MAPSHVDLLQRLERLAGSLAATKSNSASHSHLIHPFVHRLSSLFRQQPLFYPLNLLIDIKSIDCTFFRVFSFSIC